MVGCRRLRCFRRRNFGRLIPATNIEVLKTLGLLAAGAVAGLLLAWMSSLVAEGDDIILDDAYRKVRGKRRRRRRP
jgi:hypothetical protein